MPETEFLTVAEVAAYLNTSHDYVSRAIERGHLAAFRDGRRMVRVHREDLRAFVTARMTTTPRRPRRSAR